MILLFLPLYYIVASGVGTVIGSGVGDVIMWHVN